MMSKNEELHYQLYQVILEVTNEIGFALFVLKKANLQLATLEKEIAKICRDDAEYLSDIVPPSDNN